MNYKVRSGAYNVMGYGSVIVDLLDEDDRMAHIIVSKPSDCKGYQPFHIDINVDIRDDGYLAISEWYPSYDEACVIGAINKIAKKCFDTKKL